MKKLYLLPLMVLMCQKTHTQTCARVTAEIAVGELIDKITILEIKSERIANKNKLLNIHTELEILTATMLRNISMTEELIALKQQLKKINLALWEIEDDIRDQERNKTFKEIFIQLARAVYHTNDERCRIKRVINKMLGSRLIEEKSYVQYTDNAHEFIVTHS